MGLQEKVGYKWYNESPHEELEFLFVHALRISVYSVCKTSQTIHVIEVSAVIGDDRLSHVIQFVVIEVLARFTEGFLTYQVVNVMRDEQASKINAVRSLSQFGTLRIFLVGCCGKQVSTIYAHYFIF